MLTTPGNLTYHWHKQVEQATAGAAVPDQARCAIIAFRRQGFSNTDPAVRGAIQALVSIRGAVSPRCLTQVCDLRATVQERKLSNKNSSGRCPEGAVRRINPRNS
jgi:hypothetical protein